MTMAFFYFTCGIDLYVKGIQFRNLASECLFPKKWWALAFGSAYLSLFETVIYVIIGFLALRRANNWCPFKSTEVQYQNQVNE